MKRYLMIACFLLLAFLVGYLPGKMQLNRVTEQYKVARLHRLLGMALIEVQLGNFGVARERATTFFNAVAETSGEVGGRNAERLNAVRGKRDEITSDLTALRPEVAGKLRAMFLELPDPDL
ncbi:MAG: hypothetical protein SFV54_02610 [Bryobacteraceae bacterium]|nr:hypothetical protein [Bryobacteraceae bacterium]